MTPSTWSNEAVRAAKRGTRRLPHVRFSASRMAQSKRSVNRMHSGKLATHPLESGADIETVRALLEHERPVHHAELAPRHATPGSDVRRIPKLPFANDYSWPGL